MGLPKGNLIPRLGKKRTALEEAYEEAGVLGEIRNSRRVRLERSRWTLICMSCAWPSNCDIGRKRGGAPDAGCLYINWMSGCADGTW